MSIFSEHMECDQSYKPTRRTQVQTSLINLEVNFRGGTFEVVSVVSHWEGE